MRKPDGAAIVRVDLDTGVPVAKTGGTSQAIIGALAAAGFPASSAS